MKINAQHKENKIFLILIILWLAVNLLQAAFTGLINDEAYYWFYSRDLAWGYYDHPPMIAVLIKLGTIIFQGYLGVRIFIVLLSTLVIIFLKKLVNPGNITLFFLFLSSIFIFHAEGFIAVPDTVFIFFTAMFFYYYKKYLEYDNLRNSALLIVSIAGMFYSKYFALPVILFTVLSNPELLKRKSFWLIFSAVTVSLIPHLVWQINHNFVTFYFHFIERNVKDRFSFLSPLEFTGGQLLLLNPVTAFLMFKYFLKNKSSDLFSKALRYIVTGIFGLAFIFSFFKHVEANWTAGAIIPLVTLSYPVFEKKIKNHKPFIKTAVITLALILFIRIDLSTNFINIKSLKVVNQFFGWPERADKMKKTADGIPVIFTCSYQDASQYMFHTGKSSFSFNSLFYRKNQFDLEGMEPGLLGKKVILFKSKKAIDDRYETPFVIPGPDSSFLYNSFWYYKVIEHYYSYNFIKIDLSDVPRKFKTSERIKLPITIINPLDSAITVSPYGKSYLTVCFAKKDFPYKFEKIREITGLKLGKTYKTSITVETPAKPGKYYLWVSIQSGWLAPAINHRVFKVDVY